MLHRSNRPALIAGQDLSALALLIQEEHQARQRPEIQVHFQGISGELIESRNLEVTTWWSSGDLGFFKDFPWILDVLVVICLTFQVIYAHAHTLDKNGSLYDPAGTESWNMQIDMKQRN